MLTRFLNLDDTFSFMDAFERQLHHAFADNPRAAMKSQPSYSDLSLKDEGERLVVTASVPGYTKADIELTIEGEVLTLKGERKLDVPQDYKLVRRERDALQLRRQIDLGVPVQGDAIEASLEDGILTISLPKAPEAKPRKIAIGGYADNRIGSA